MMWYSALEVAKYIVARCFELGKPISNLKLQKMLYFIWVDFYKITHKMLFTDDICAWQLGPVVPEVYYEFCSYAGRPIPVMYSTEIDGKDQKILDTIIDRYIEKPASELVNMTHASGTAWDQVYKNGSGNRQVIPPSLIIERES